VCDGQVSLARAQRAIARDWETAESRLGLGTGPAPAPQPQPTHVAGKLRCTASASTPSPADYHTVYIYVRTAPGVSVSMVAHYKSTDNPRPRWRTGQAGPRSPTTSAELHLATRSRSASRLDKL